MSETAFQAARRGDGQAVMNAIATDPQLLGAKEDANGWTLLHMFARLSSTQTVQQLLALGCDTEERDRSFRTVLHMAARADAAPSLASTETATGEPAAEAATQGNQTSRAIATVRAWGATPHPPTRPSTRCSRRACRPPGRAVTRRRRPTTRRV